MIRTYIRATLLFAVVALAASLSACSYMMDAIEGAITDRASFSIDAVYNAGTISITWNESGSTNFAGFEVYMTDEVDNEYAGYEIIGSHWAYGTISSSSYYRQASSLGNETCNSYTVDSAQVTAIRGAVASGKGPGVYFFRVGIMDWDQNEGDRNSDNGYTGNTFTDYCDHTEFDQISGYAKVTIP
jgi:hypothetical protein